MARKLNLVLLALLLLIGAPFWWLMIDNWPGATAAPAEAPSMPELRRLAGSINGPAPQAIHVALIGWARVPGDLFAAGVGLKRRLIGVSAYRVDLPGRAPLVIESGLTAGEAQKLRLENYLGSAQQLVDHWLDTAGLTLFTHEHFDHMGGLVAALHRPGGDRLLAQARFNPAQLPPAPLAATLDWPRGLALPRPSLGPGPQAVAPGVVVIPAPGHTPGSQMIYVRLGNGREYLFTGDTATLNVSWRQQRARSRLISKIIGHPAEDRAAVYGWLATINRWHREAPAMVIVPGHEWEALFNAPDHWGMVIERGLVPVQERED
jgi:glyoxylase-like metal-dependent hydrolase (beta-lactamase superfamily II)